ncbi:hypothetical protein DL93DRAFT_2178402 [Clavulina sp. PMI_390]|nr:hypothetical protein DL93DRAFT_2178402 [Clavulina sp. PMI_390]
MDKVEVIYPFFKVQSFTSHQRLYLMQSYQFSKIPMMNPEDLSKMWQSDELRSASITQLFIQVTEFSLSICTPEPTSNDPDPVSLKALIRFHEARIPPLSDAIDDWDPNILISHTTLYGSSAILHSLYAGQTVQARSEMLQSVYMLVDISRKLQARKGFRGSQAPLVLITHMMNAIRILTHEIRRADVLENPTLCVEHCNSMKALLDFVDDTTARYPAWRYSPDVVKGMIAFAMDSLKG